MIKMNINECLPEACVWELTLQCNMRCIHCGSIAGGARNDELTVDECLGIADELLELGCRQITFIGGEVFLYKGWEKIARKLFEGGALVNIITNAFLMEDAQIEQIKYARLVNLGISVDGMEENHNRIRNSNRSFKKVLKAFERLRNENIPIAVVTSLMDFNFDDLESMYELFVENGVSVWQIQIATAMGNMKKHKSVLLNPSKIPSITRFIKDKRDEQQIRLYAGDNIGYYDENELYLRNSPGTISAWQGCQAGLRVIGIDSVGNVKGCESLYDDKFIEGNLREESLKEIWYKEGNFSYNRQFDPSRLEGKCASCDKGQICRAGCHGSCHFTTGSIFENPYCCYPKIARTPKSG
jgi:radical SAM protein with 4Fe4S-binding SPASM domain